MTNALTFSKSIEYISRIHPVEGQQKTFGMGMPLIGQILCPSYYSWPIHWASYRQLSASSWGDGSHLTSITALWPCVELKLAKAIQEYNKNIFSTEQNHQCYSLLFFQCENATHCSTHADFINSNHCLQLVVASSSSPLPSSLVLRGVCSTCLPLVSPDWFLNTKTARNRFRLELFEMD